MSTTTREDTEVGALLRASRDGDSAATNRLFELLYDELRTMARRRLARESREHTHPPTSLVHETMLRLHRARLPCEDRSTFLRLAGAVMRRILIDGARRRHSRDRALAARAAEGVASDAAPSAYVVLLDQALAKLEAIDPQLARVVSLRFLAGCSVADTSAALGVSSAKVVRDWRTARAFLQLELGRDASE